MFKKKNIKKSNLDICIESTAKETQKQIQKANQSSDDSEDDDQPVQYDQNVAFSEDRKYQVRRKIIPTINSRNEEDQTTKVKSEVQRILDEEMGDLKDKPMAPKEEGEGEGEEKERVTAFNEIDTEETMDARAKALKRQEISLLVREGKLKADEYRGKGYSTIYTTKSEEEIRKSKITGSMGAIRASANVRRICRTDYDPSLCKDYHNTGYCVFGDSCLYLHDRGDYKSGYEQDEDWARQQLKRQKRMEGEDDSQDSEAEDIENELKNYDVPKACSICNGKFRNPVRTLCEHFFCEACALQQYGQGNGNCAICQKATQGVFQDASTILIKMRKERNEEKNKLKKKASSAKGLKMLEESDYEGEEEEDEAEENHNQSGKLYSTKKQKKLREKQNQKREKSKQLVEERIYIDENGCEVVETVLQGDKQSQSSSEEDQQDEQDQENEGSQQDDSDESENDEKDSFPSHQRGEQKQKDDESEEDEENEAEQRQMAKAMTSLRRRKQDGMQFKAMGKEWLE